MTDGKSSKTELVHGRYAFRDLVDLTRLQDVFIQFSRSTGYTTGLVSHPERELLVSSGWRTVCTDFHRGSPASREQCIESNVALMSELEAQQDLSVCSCGLSLMDAATPIIVRGAHVANVVTGQVFFEPPDLERFREQAARYGYDEQSYLEAVREVPVVDEAAFRSALAFIGDIALLLAEQGLANQATKGAEEAAVQEKELLDRTINSIPGILYLFTQEGEVLRWNENFETISGYSSAEIARMHPLDFIDARDRKFVSERIGEVFATGESVVEARFLPKSGERIPFVLTGKRIVLDGVPCQVGVGIDISERKRAEEEKASLEEQLRQSQKMEALGRLAGGVAHDFNNILTGINGYAELILHRLSPTDPLHAEIREILNAGERAASLTSQLLAFSRKQVISPRVIRPNEILERSQMMLRRIIGEDIELVFLPDPDLDSIEADPAQIDQILVNLAVNARDAMPDGGRLVVETRNASIDEAFCTSHVDARPGDYVMLAVSDTGEGMDAATLSNIFDPFFSTKAPGQGTGLGLATVFGIVKQNQGFILVTSEPELGTTFKVYFRSTGEHAEPLPAQEVPDLPRGTETVLLVEDEPVVLGLTREILEQHGYSVIAMEDGQTACDYCTDHDDDIDLLVTDVIMPGMNGLELYKRLATERPGLKALFMSGYTADVIGLGGILEEGMTFLQKPFPIKRLIRKVRDVLDA